MRRFAMVVSGWLCLSGCAQVPTGGPPRSVPLSPTAQPATEAAAAPAARPRSLLVAAPSASNFVLRVDGIALRGAPLYAGLRQSLEMMPAISRVLESWSQKCRRDVLDTVDELVLAAEEKNPEPLIVARVRPGGPDPLACAASIAGATGRMEVDGGVRSLRGPKTVVAAQDDVVAYGSGAAVDSALGALRSGGEVSSQAAREVAAMGRQALAAAASNRDAGFESATLRIAADGSGLRASFRIQLSDARGTGALADRIREQIADTRGRLARVAGPAAANVEPIVSAILVSEMGANVETVLVVQGGAAEQTAAAGVFNVLAIGGVRTYRALSKAREARRTVDTIAAQLQAHVRRDARKRFPASAPLTPASVPSGMIYVPAPADWSNPTWRAIGFQLLEPTPYSYGIETSKDGRTAVVVARGDLNGDGKQSSFARAMKLAADGSVTIAPEMTVTDERE